jgi:hypothetical protein
VRADTVATIETAIRTGSVASGLARLRRVLLELGTDSVTPSLAVLDRIEAARALLDSRPATLVRWIGRLLKALEALGALDALRADTAGQALLDLLEALAETCMDFLEQQQHLDRQLYHTVNACLHDYSAAPETPNPLAA